MQSNKPTMRFTFRNLILARQFARRCNYPATVVLGDRDNIWVVSFGEAARLVKQGYQLAN